MSGNAIPPLKFDHLVVAAATLNDGIAWVRDQIGVDVPAGGKHVRMGTHNAVGQFGNDTYLEIIALDPEAGPVSGPRWFSFDDPTFLESLERDGPRLAHWVTRSADIEGTVRASGGAVGTPMDMARDDLRWKIAVRDDGRLLERGLVPTVMAWPDGVHPSRRMAGLGLHLERLELHHPEPDALARQLAVFGADGLVDIVATEDGRKFLTAHLVRGDRACVLSGA